MKRQGKLLCGTQMRLKTKNLLLDLAAYGVEVLIKIALAIRRLRLCVAGPITFKRQSVKTRLPTGDRKVQKKEKFFSFKRYQDIWWDKHY
jgi:hypothetical protein